MAVEQFIIEELQGMDRNIVDGLGKRPHVLRAFSFERQGGLIWRGKRTSRNTYAIFDLRPTVAFGQTGLFWNFGASPGSQLRLDTYDGFKNKSTTITSPWYSSIPDAVYGYRGGATANEAGWRIIENNIIGIVEAQTYAFPPTVSAGSSSNTPNQLPNGNYVFAVYDFELTRHGFLVTKEQVIPLTIGSKSAVLYGAVGTLSVTTTTATLTDTTKTWTTNQFQNVAFVTLVKNGTQIATALITANTATTLTWAAPTGLPTGSTATGLRYFITPSASSIEFSTTAAQDKLLYLLSAKSFVTPGDLTATAITGATQANPVVITSTSHGLVTGNQVFISGVGGMTQINNRTFTVNVLTADTFELVGENGTGHTAYSSGGIATKVMPPFDLGMISSPCFVTVLEPALPLSTRVTPIGLRNDLDSTKISSDVVISPHHDLTVLHQGRFYYANPILGHGFAEAGPGAKESGMLKESEYPAGNLTLGVPLLGKKVYYSEPLIKELKTLPDGSREPFAAINMTKVFNNFEVPFEKSKEITALISTPAGLLIFGNLETFLFRGEPLSSPSLIKFSGTIGCDEITSSVFPATSIKCVSIGGTVFVIYNGEIYAISLGMGDIDFGGAVEKISDSVTLKPNINFMALSVNYAENLLYASDFAGGIFVFDVQRKQWVESNFSKWSNSDNILSRSGNWVLLNYSNTIYFNENASFDSQMLAVDDYQNFSTGGYVTGDDPGVISFKELDFGDKKAFKLFRSVEIYTNPQIAGVTISMDYSIGPTTGTVAADTPGNNGRWIFRLPVGLSAPTASFTFTFRGMNSRPSNFPTTPISVIEPPIIFNYVPLSRRRI